MFPLINISQIKKANKRRNTRYSKTFEKKKFFEMKFDKIYSEDQNFIIHNNIFKNDFKKYLSKRPVLKSNHARDKTSFIFKKVKSQGNSPSNNLFGVNNVQESNKNLIFNKKQNLNNVLFYTELKSKKAAIPMFFTDKKNKKCNKNFIFKSPEFKGFKTPEKKSKNQKIQAPKKERKIYRKEFFKYPSTKIKENNKNIFKFSLNILNFDFDKIFQKTSLKTSNSSETNSIILNKNIVKYNKKLELFGNENLNTNVLNSNIINKFNSVEKYTDFNKSITKQSKINHDLSETTKIKSILNNSKKQNTKNKKIINIFNLSDE